MLRKMMLMLMAVLMMAMTAQAEPETDTTMLSSGELCSVTYSNSGNEEGNIYRASIDYTEEGTLVLMIEEREHHQAPLVVSRYSAASDTLCRIAALVEANGMEQWEGREDKMTVCDAPQPWLTLYIYTADGEVRQIGIDGYIIFSDSEREAYQAVLRLIHENRDEAHLLETYQVEQYDAD